MKKNAVFASNIGPGVIPHITNLQTFFFKIISLLLSGVDQDFSLKNCIIVKYKIANCTDDSFLDGSSSDNFIYFVWYQLEMFPKGLLRT